MPHASDPTSRSDVAPDRTRASLAAREARGTLWARLHGLTGVGPLALYLVLHLVDQALRAAPTAGTVVSASVTTRLLTHPLTRTVVIASLCVHGAIGLSRMARARYDLRRHPTSRNWMHALQHATGLFALGFIVLHAIHIVLPLARGQVRFVDSRWELIAGLSSTQASVPWLALGYMVGIGACSFHLANGLWRFATTRAVALSPTARRGLAVGCALLGLVLLGLGANTTVLLATGSALPWSGEPVPPADPASSGSACPDTASRELPATSASGLTPPPPPEGLDTSSGR